MPKSRVTYPASGTGPYVIPFGYLEQTHIVAYVDGVVDPDASVDAVTNTVTTLLVPSTDVEIRRSTPTTPLVDWINRSTIKESNLDLATLQGLYVSEELEDAQASAAEASIADGSVTTIKIADGAVTEAKLHPDVVAQLGAGGVSDHGALTGLVDDDHTQYHNDTRGDARYNTKAEITSALSTKSNVGHSHSQADVVGLETELGLKLEAADIAGKSDVGHTHDDRYFTESEITSSLAGKANTSHLHVTSDVTGLDSALAGKASTSHTHTAANVTDFDTEVANNSAVVANTAKVSFPEAPIDGTPYSRQDAGWVAGGGGGIADAPSDGTEYVRQDATWVANSGGTPVEVGSEPIYNAITDGGLNADYVSESSPGTNDSALAETWILAGQAAGKKKFYFPTGDYRWDLNNIYIANDADYDYLEFFGDGIERTVLHVPGWQDIDQDYNLFRIAGLDKTCRHAKFHDMEIRVGWHCGEGFDDGTARGWSVYPWTWEASVWFEDGQAWRSTDGNYIIKFNEAGQAAGTEPDWSTFPTSHNGYSCTVKLINARPDAGTMTAGEFYLYSDPIVVYCSQTGTNLATASEPTPPQLDGNGEFDIKGVSMGLGTVHSEVWNCRFKGFIGYSNAGGGGVTTGSWIYGEHEFPGDVGYRAGRGYCHIHDCIFEEMQFGCGIVGSNGAVQINDCLFKRCGGWGSRVGGFTVHSIYGQMGQLIVDRCRFVEQFGGVCAKIHGNPPNRDCIGTVLSNCEFIDFEWVAISMTASGITPADANPDFDWTDPLLSNRERGYTIHNCTFRETKTINQGSFCAIMDQLGASGVSVIGCQFFDVMAFYSSATTYNGYLDGSYSGIQFIGNYVSHTWRTVAAWDGAGQIIGNFIDLRGAARSVSTETFLLRDWATMKDNNIWVRGCNSASPGTGVIGLQGDNITVEGNLIYVKDDPDTIFVANGNFSDIVIRNNRLKVDTASIMRIPGRTGTYRWTWDGNTVIGTPAGLYIRGPVDDQWVFRNNSGPFWANGYDSSPHSGAAALMWSSTDGGTTNARQYDATNRFHLVDMYGQRCSDPADIYGVALFSNDGSGFFTAIAFEEQTHQIIKTSEAVTIRDWVILDGTNIGEVKPNGTTGSTTEPSSGFVGRVINVGDAGAGAGYATIEVYEWNRVSPAGGGLDATDIDTLAELNAIITDATLIDTADSRLSDARTPTAHTHTLADVTDSGTAAALNVPAAGDAAAGEVVKGNDTRLTNARTPTAHTHTASEVTDFDTEVANNSAVTANTAKVTNATHTGDATGATALTIANDVVTNAKLANVATATIKGRITASTGDPEDLTATQVRTLINVANGATANSADATLLGRANHTGTQAQSTVTDLVSDLAAKPNLADANVWPQTQSYGEGTLTDGTNISWNVQTDPCAKVTLAGNRTLDNPSNLVAGTTYVLRVIQDATGSRTLAYGSAYKWPGGTAPTLTTTASAIDVLTFYCDGTNLYGVEALAFA